MSLWLALDGGYNGAPSWQSDRDNDLGSTLTIPGTTHGGAGRKSVTVGDLMIVVAEMNDYVLRPGAKMFDPADAVLPPGWKYVGGYTVRAGGDPRKISKLWLVFAANLTSEMVAQGVDGYGPYVVPWTIRFPTWRYGTSGENISAGLNAWQKHCAYVFRGEVGISDLFGSQSVVPSSTAGAPAAWTPGNAGSAVLTVVDTTGQVAGFHKYIGKYTSAPSPWTGDYGVVHSGVVAPGATLGSYHVLASVYAPGAIRPTTGTSAALSIGVSNVVVPLQPVVTSPSSGQWRDFANRGLVIEYEYRAGLAGPQLGYYLNRTIAGQTGLTYWNQDTATWQATAYLNPWFGHRVTLPPGFMANGLQATFQLSTVSTSGVASKPCDAFTVYGVNGPAAQVQIVGASSGQVADMTPSVQVTGTPGTDLAVIDGYRAWMYDNLTGDLLASITADGTARWDPGVMLVDGQQIRVEAQSRQTGGEYSPTVMAIATVNVTVPPAPRIAATPTYEPQTSLPGIRLEFTWPASTFDWSAGGVRVAIQRSSTEHPELVHIATYVTGPGETGFTVFDYTAPTGQASRYTAQATSITPDGGKLVGQYGHSNDVQQDDESCWLIDPTDPASAARLSIAKREPWAIGSRQGIEMLGRPDLLVSSRGWTYPTGSLQLRATEIATIRRAVALLNSDRKLFLRWCSEVDDQGDVDHPDMWFLVKSAITVERMTVGPFPWRQFSFEYAETPPLVVQS